MTEPDAGVGADRESGAPDPDEDRSTDADRDETTVSGAEGMTDPGDDAQSDPGPTVSVDGVRHWFGDVSVLDGVSFSLVPGTVTAVVGPNGSGKTTLLQIVAGVLAPRGGRVEVADDTGRAVGYLPQRPAFSPAFTVGETLSFYADLLDGEVDVEGALSAVGLAGVADRSVDALSGGMVRLLGIAQATLGDPAVMILDEPTGDLDPRMTRHVFETVVSAVDDETAILLATHDLGGAVLADEVLVLDRGELVATGPPGELLGDGDLAQMTDAFMEHVGGGPPTVRTGQDGAGCDDEDATTRGGSP